MTVPRLLLLSLFASLSLGATCDPVNADKIASLGPENPNVRRGPLHRPGQPCLVCHDGAIGDPPAFSVAGTIYQTPSSPVGLAGAIVTMIDSAGNQHVAPATNAAGNFYVTPDEWSPAFPLTTVTMSPSKTSSALLTMYSEDGRSGSCATCHVTPAGPGSPGPVVAALDDGGTPL